MLKLVLSILLTATLVQQTFAQDPSGNSTGDAGIVEKDTLSVLPRLAIFDIRGNRFDSDEVLEQGKYILLGFFTTYCKPCIEEFPGFLRLKEEFDESLELVLVSVGQDSREALKRFQLTNRLDPATVIRDRFGLMRREFKLDDFVPYTFLADPLGRIVHFQRGAFSGGDPYKVLAPLLRSEDKDE